MCYDRIIPMDGTIFTFFSLQALYVGINDKSYRWITSELVNQGAEIFGKKKKKSILQIILDRTKFFLLKARESFRIL